MPVIHVLRETVLRTWLKTLRRPVLLTFSLVQPLLWMLIFGFLFQRFALDPGAGRPYLDFLLPGVCAMTVLFGASPAGIMVVRDLQTGFLQRMALASAHPGWMRSETDRGSESGIYPVAGARGSAAGSVAVGLGSHRWVAPITAKRSRQVALAAHSQEPRLRPGIRYRSGGTRWLISNST